MLHKNNALSDCRGNVQEVQLIKGTVHPGGETPSGRRAIVLWLDWRMFYHWIWQGNYAKIGRKM
jgi:hypothetical protein